MEIQLFSKGKWSIGRPIVAEQFPWFQGKAVATSLEYGDPGKALRVHVDDEDQKTLRELLQGVTATVTPLNRQPHEVYINESERWAFPHGRACSIFQTAIC